MLRILDIYDDPNYIVLQKYATDMAPDQRQTLKNYAKRPEENVHLSDNLFAYVSYSDKNLPPVRKFRIDTPAETEMSIVYFMQTYMQLPTPSQGIVAKRLTTAALQFGVPIPPALDKLAGNGQLSDIVSAPPGASESELTPNITRTLGGIIDEGVLTAEDYSKFNVESLIDTLDNYKKLKFDQRFKIASEIARRDVMDSVTSRQAALISRYAMPVMDKAAAEFYLGRRADMLDADDAARNSILKIAEEDLDKAASDIEYLDRHTGLSYKWGNGIPDPYESILGYMDVEPTEFMKIAADIKLHPKKYDGLDPERLQKFASGETISTDDAAEDNLFRFLLTKKYTENI